jgi:hypothetical protein
MVSAVLHARAFNASEMLVAAFAGGSPAEPAPRFHGGIPVRWDGRSKVTGSFQIPVDPVSAPEAIFRCHAWQ